MQEPAKVNEFLDYIENLNENLSVIKYNAKVYPVSFHPMTVCIIGGSANKLVEYLSDAGKIKARKEVETRYGRKVFTVEFFNEL